MKSVSGIHSLLLVALLSACSVGGGAATPPLDRVPLEITSTRFTQLESYPVQLLLHLEGTLPNPCTTPVWEVERPGSDGETIRVEVYGVPDGSEVCIAMLAPFEANIPLGSASGEVRVLLNGEEISKLTLP